MLSSRSYRQPSMKETSDFLPIGLTRSLIDWFPPIIIDDMGKATHLQWRDLSLRRRRCDRLDLPASWIMRI